MSGPKGTFSLLAGEDATSATLQSDLGRLLGETSTDRGKIYADSGRVLECTVDEARSHIVAAVRGTSLYRQDITLHWTSGHLLQDVGGQCTCPVGWNCKHVAAAIFRANELGALQTAPAPVASHRGLEKTPAPVELPRAVEAWLRQFPHAVPPPLQEDYPANVRDRIFYVLERAGQGLAVHPMKVGLLKDGSVGKSRRRYDFRNVNSDAPPKFIRPVDLRIFRLLRSATPYSYYGMDTKLPEGEDGQRLMELLVGTGRAFWQEIDSPGLTLSEPETGRFAWREMAAEQRLMVQTATGEWLTPLPIAPPWYVDAASGACGRLDSDQLDHRAAWLANAPPVRAATANALAEAVLRVAGTTIPRPRIIQQEVIRDAEPVPVLRLGVISARELEYDYWRRSSRPRFGQNDIAPALSLFFDYEGRRIAPDDPARSVERMTDGCLRLIERNAESEAAWKAALEKYAQQFGFTHADDLIGEAELGDCAAQDLVLWPFDATDPLGPTRGGQRAVGFLNQVVPALRQEGWRIEVEARWPCPLKDVTPRLSGRVEDGDGSWFSLALSYEVDGEDVELLPVILRFLRELPAETLADADLMQRKIAEMSYVVRLRDGRYAALPLAPLAPAFQVFIDLQERMHPAEARVLPTIAEALAGCSIPFTGGEALCELGVRLGRLGDPLAVPLPAGFRGELRPYQTTGMGWMLALAETGFGGILADDMGLGKTVQALAYLAARHAGQGPEHRPSLLIVPTSLVGTWQREAARFAPDLSVLALHGPNRRDDIERIAEHDLVITTYPLLHRDHSALFAQNYDSVILDEAQAVKNPTSQAAKLIRDIKAHQRFALSGTPLENNLEELWSLFDWLIPGLLGSRKSFTEQFRKPIEKDGDRARQQLLSRRISPFLLRRTKDQVAHDLPPRTEVVETVPLQGAQRALYETLRAAMDQRVRAALEQKGLSGSRITVLDALLKLRQACCDPQLVKLPSAQSVTTSAKRAHLMAMLEELIAEGRRVLIFSQFVEMLRLIEIDVRARGWDYLWLSGETRQRSELVEAFQKGHTPLFLISLKAGGVGLTLTAADTVILYDPWWNPAVERQAMDRAHRIGQHKPVFVHRLIAEGTVETRIAEMQTRKQALADALFDPDNTGPLAMSEEEILSLFAPNGEPGR